MFSTVTLVNLYSGKAGLSLKEYLPDSRACCLHPFTTSDGYLDVSLLPPFCLSIHMCRYLLIIKSNEPYIEKPDNQTWQCGME